jgi:hypothetical protein
MKRREFLIGAAAAAGLVHSRKGWAQARDEAKLRRVAIMSLCFNSILKNPSQPDAPARTLDVMDLGQMLADRYGVHNVEMQHAHFPATDAAYLKDFRERLAKTKSQVTNINLEFGPQNISRRSGAAAAGDRSHEGVDRSRGGARLSPHHDQSGPAEPGEQGDRHRGAEGDGRLRQEQEHQGGDGKSRWRRRPADARRRPTQPLLPLLPLPAPAAWVLLVEIIKAPGPGRTAISATSRIRRRSTPASAACSR